LPKLAKFYKEHKDEKEHFEIVAIEIMSKNEAALKKSLKKLEKKLWKGEALPFPVMLDDSRATSKAYKVQAYPTCYLINPEGKIVVADHFGVEKRLAKELAKIKEEAAKKK
jgi:hypothetical protein